MKRLLLTLLSLAAWSITLGCSSAVVAPHLSKEGGVIIWKHRDQTATNDCHIAHFKGGKYAYTALVNSYVGVGTTALGGVNEVGFGYISTATKNLHRQPAVARTRNSKYSLMVHALRECKSVDEFEALLSTYHRYASFESNVGVGDAEGNAAYFEIWSDGYRRYDVKDFDVRTNFSFAATTNIRGSSERRYRTVMEQMKGQKGFCSQDFIDYSRCFWSADKGDVLASATPYKDANYVVPRASSVAAIVIVCSKNPRIDAIVGHPVSGMVVPVWVAAEHNIPKCVAGREMYDLGRKFVSKAYIPKAGEKGLYLNKELVSKVLKVNHDIPAPKRMPTDIIKFNNKIDAIFEKHRSQMMQLLQ